MPRCIKNKVHKVILDSFLLRDKSRISLSIWPQVLVVAVVKSKAPYFIVMIAQQTSRSLVSNRELSNFFHACMTANTGMSDGPQESVLKSFSPKSISHQISNGANLYWFLVQT